MDSSSQGAVGNQSFEACQSRFSIEYVCVREVESELHINARQKQTQGRKRQKCLSVTTSEGLTFWFAEVLSVESVPRSDERSGKKRSDNEEMQLGKS